jgi:hypothetical protein
MSKARELAELGAAYDSGALSNRNLIINGAMEVAQRGTAAHNEGSGYFSLDRWYQQKSNQDQFTYSVEQVSDGPSGFSKCLRVTTSTAETALASDEFGRIYQAIEGQNLVRVGFGTADAKPLTVSFYVKSSITGNFSCSLYINDANVVYSQAYTINAANTWEYKTLSIPAYTTAGPNLDNTQGAILNFGLFAGSGINTATSNWTSYSTTYLLGGQTANLAATLNDSWRITGIQLEVGTEATPFEHRSFGQELALCYRYFYKVEKSGYIIGRGNGTTAITDLRIPCPVALRAQPSFDATGTSYAMDADSYVSASNVGFAHQNTSGASVNGQITGLSSMTDNRICAVSLAAGYSLDAEL